VGLRDWALELLDGIGRIAALLGDEEPDSYMDAIELARRHVEDPSLLPSARVLAELQGGGRSFAEFALAQSLQHREQFLAEPPPDALLARFERDALLSLEQQRVIEAADRISFDEYVSGYFRQ
jgi:glutamate--cysteine ligase